MQTETITASGKRTSLTPNSDMCFVNPNASRLNVEYAKARANIQEDFKLNVKMNEAMARRIRRQSKHTIVEFLKGKVSKNKEGQYIVTFPDNTVARL